jgi:hypothetical protein
MRMKKEMDEVMNMSDTEMAVKMVNSPRGEYILGQALWYAIRELSKVESPCKEVSNIADMEFLMENLFPTFAMCQRIEAMDKATK